MQFPFDLFLAVVCWEDTLLLLELLSVVDRELALETVTRQRGSGRKHCKLHSSFLSPQHLLLPGKLNLDISLYVPLGVME